MRVLWQWAIIVGFFTAIAAPLAGTLLTRAWSQREPVAEAFTSSVQAASRWEMNAAWLATVEELFDEELFDKEYLFRDTLSRLHSYILVHMLSTSPNSRVIVGEDGWLFFNNDNARMSYSREDPFTEEELAQWAEILQQRHRYLEARGIAYLFVVAPDKSAIYGEYMPKHIRQHDNLSRAEQLIAYLDRHTDVQALYLRDALVQAKPLHQLYYKTDTHWTPLGGYVGYRAIAARLREAYFPEFKPATLEEIRYVQKYHRSADLARMVKLDAWPSEPAIRLLNRRYPEFVREPVANDGLGPFAVGEVPENGFRIPFVVETEGPSRPRAIFVRDSFTEYLIPFLVPHFERSLFVGIPNNRQQVTNPFHLPLIEREQPDLVAEIMIERYLMRKVPLDNPPDLIAALKELDLQGRPEEAFQ